MTVPVYALLILVAGAVAVGFFLGYWSGFARGRDGR